MLSIKKKDMSLTDDLKKSQKILKYDHAMMLHDVVNILSFINNRCALQQFHSQYDEQQRSYICYYSYLCESVTISHKQYGQDLSIHLVKYTQKKKRVISKDTEDISSVSKEFDNSQYTAVRDLSPRYEEGTEFVMPEIGEILKRRDVTVLCDCRGGRRQIYEKKLFKSAYTRVYRALCGQLNIDSTGILDIQVSDSKDGSRDYAISLRKLLSVGVRIFNNCVQNELITTKKLAFIIQSYNMYLKNFVTEYDFSSKFAQELSSMRNIVHTEVLYKNMKGRISVLCDDIIMCQKKSRLFSHARTIASINLKDEVQHDDKRIAVHYFVKECRKTVPAYTIMSTDLSAQRLRGDERIVVSDFMIKEKERSSSVSSTASNGTPDDGYSSATSMSPVFSKFFKNIFSMQYGCEDNKKPVVKIEIHKHILKLWYAKHEVNQIRGMWEDSKFNDYYRCLVLDEKIMEYIIKKSSGCTILCSEDGIINVISTMSERYERDSAIEFAKNCVKVFPHVTHCVVQHTLSPAGTLVVDVCPILQENVISI